jgi:vacuolar-type H+-ATPase subunit E/Vma4
VTETPIDRAALRAEIIRTRQELGQTIEALAAKTDVKARAKDTARDLRKRALERAERARDRALESAGRSAPAVLAVAGMVLVAVVSYLAWRRRA